MTPKISAQYRLITRLGAGGFAEVWEVETHDGARYVAKIPHVVADPDVLWRFRREVRLQSQLAHPNVVSILDFDVDADPPWFVMERADMNFRAILGVLEPASAVGLLRQAALGIEHAHRNRVIHRDLKPENILIFRSKAAPMRSAVADFGLGRPLTRTASETASRLAAGTPGYAAPEQWRDFKNADASADIYALGKILEEIRAHDMEGSLPSGLEYCVFRATATNPADRYQDATSFVADVDTVVSEPLALARPEDIAFRLLRDLMTGMRFDAELTEPLSRLIFANRRDSRLLLVLMPRLAGPLMQHLFNNHADVMREVLQEYIRLLANPLAVDYAMQAISLLDEVLAIAPDSALRGSVAARVIQLAVEYDLREGGFVIARYLANEADPSALLSLRDLFRANPALAAWCRSYVTNVPLPPLLRAVIAESR